MTSCTSSIGRALPSATRTPSMIQTTLISVMDVMTFTNVWCQICLLAWVVTTILRIVKRIQNDTSSVACQTLGHIVLEFRLFQIQIRHTNNHDPRNQHKTKQHRACQLVKTLYLLFPFVGIHRHGHHCNKNAYDRGEHNDYNCLLDFHFNSNDSSEQLSIKYGEYFLIR